MQDNITPYHLVYIRSQFICHLSNMAVQKHIIVCKEMSRDVCDANGQGLSGVVGRREVGELTISEDILYVQQLLLKLHCCFNLSLQLWLHVEIDFCTYAVILHTIYI